MTRKRKRELDRQERLLWETVTRSVAPLRGREKALSHNDTLAAPETMLSSAPGPTSVAQKAGATPKLAGRSAKISPPAMPVLPPIVTMIRKERRAVVRGVAQIDAKLDLHGCRQDEAHRTLRAFLIRAAASGYRTVLIVTGKGASENERPNLAWTGESGRGVLRRLAPMLLESTELRDIVLGYEQADQRHGGAGALYVRLRRRSG